MPRPPDLLNLVAWLAALWLAAATVMLVLVFSHPSVRFHWTTVVYLGATALFSLLAFGAMGTDKYRASTGKRRVPELALHVFELLGGWPGSLLGQRTFRHKNRKIIYQAVFWGIVAVHLVLLAWTLYLWWNPPVTGPPPEPAAEAAEPAAE
ncbi:MAG TPA: DUF1294 domain-containing protein [Planctomycetaceae bacterium]